MNFKRLTALFGLWSLMGLLVVLTAISGCARHGNMTGLSQNKISIKGSDTMVHLVSDWAEAFMKSHPGSQVSVTGGGSGTGIAALLNNTTDIASASRNISPEEEKVALQKGLHLKEVTVGRDAIAVIVNPKNPLNALALDQLRQLFSGKVTNWQQVGGPNKPVLVYSRESSSGTYAFFREHVLKNTDYSSTARLMPATSSIIEAVSSDQGGIGYVGLGYAVKATDKIKVLAIQKTASSPAIAPSEETVMNETYPIARALFLYIPENASPLANTFSTFCLGPEGQKLLTTAGYVPASNTTQP